MMQAERLFLGLMLVLVLSVDSRASSSGIDGFSGDPATGGLTCNECHEGGVMPTVALSGPTQVQPGSTNTYSLTISGGQLSGGGLDVSVTDGFFTSIDSGTQVVDGEVLHRFTRGAAPNGDVTWFMNWTAPPNRTTVTLYGAGNSVNQAGGPNGDRANTDVLVVTVGSQTPGETSGEGFDPLLVTGFDPVTGDLALSYETACETTSNNIYFGPLDQVATLGFSGDVCGIGVSGSYTSFNPGSGSYFFVVVGTRDPDEGSYGSSVAIGGAEQERGPWAGQTCGQEQDLSAGCN
jgi:hypothetical protein